MLQGDNPAIVVGNSQPVRMETKKLLSVTVSSKCSPMLGVAIPVSYPGVFKSEHPSTF